MFEKGVGVYLLLCLTEFQGSISDLLMEFPAKGPAICCRVIDISMKAAKLQVLLILLDCYLLSFRELDYAIRYPLIKNSYHFFCGTRNRRWWFLEGLFGQLLSLIVYGGHRENLWLAFLFPRLLGMWLDR